MLKKLLAITTAIIPLGIVAAHAADVGAIPWTALGQPGGAQPMGVVSTDHSTVSIPVIDNATGLPTTAIFPSSAFTLPGLLTLPTLAILNSGMVLNSTPGEALTVLLNAAPGATFTVSTPNNDMSIRGNIVQVATGATLTASETMSITETASGYATQTFTFAMTGYAPINGPNLDLSVFTGGAAPMNSDAFTTYPNYWTPTNTSGTYFTAFDNNGNNATNYNDTVSRTESTNGEAERYTDSSYPPSHPIDPFEVIPGGMLHIKTRPKDSTISTIAGFNTSDIQWTSGLLRYRDARFTSYCMQTRAISTGTNGIFSAAWNYPLYGSGIGVEDDGLGEFTFVPSDFRVLTEYKHFGVSPAGSISSMQVQLNVPPILGTGAFHTTTVCHTPSYLITGVDHKYTSNQSTPSDWLVSGVNKQFDLLMNVAVKDFSGAGITVTAMDAYFDGWKAWAASDPSSAPPHGAPTAMGSASMGGFLNATTVAIGGYAPGAQTSEVATDIHSVWRPTGTTTWPSANVQGSGTPGNGNFGQVFTSFPAGTSVDFGLFASNAYGNGPTFPLAPSLYITTPLQQAPGVAFTVSGSFYNTALGPLDYQTDGAWTACGGSAPASAAFSCTGVTVASANSAATVKLRDHNNQTTTSASASFSVATSSGAHYLALTGAADNNNYAYFPGSTGIELGTATPIQVDVRISPAALSGTQVLLAKWNNDASQGSSQKEFYFAVAGATLVAGWTDSAGTEHDCAAGATISSGLQTVRVVLTPSANGCAFYTSPDDTSYSQIGSAVSASGSASGLGIIAPSSGQPSIQVGVFAVTSSSSPNQAPYSGNVYRASVVTGGTVSGTTGAISGGTQRINMTVGASAATESVSGQTVGLGSDVTVH